MEAGYRARITLRKPEQATRIKQAPSLASYQDAIEFTIVPDITASKAYAEAIKSVDGVLHIASPIPHALPKADVGSTRTVF